MIKLCFEASTPEQLRADLLEYVDGPQVISSSTKVDDYQSQLTEPTPPKKRKPRKTKAQKEAEAAANAGNGSAMEAMDVSGNLEAQGYKAPTITDVRQALQDVVAKKDMIAGRNILKKYAVEKAAGLMPDQYTSFIHDCHLITGQVVQSVSQ